MQNRRSDGDVQSLSLRNRRDSVARMNEDHVIRVERTIDATPDAVFRVLDDFDRYPEWNPFTERVITDRRVGNPVVLHVNMPGKSKRVMNERLSAYVPGKRMAWGVRWGFGLVLRCDRVQEVEPLPDGRTRYVCYEGFEGWLAPVVVKFFGGSVRAGFDSVADALVRRVATV